MRKSIIEILRENNFKQNFDLYGHPYILLLPKGIEIIYYYDPLKSVLAFTQIDENNNTLNVFLDEGVNEILISNQDNLLNNLITLFLLKALKENDKLKKENNKLDLSLYKLTSN